MSREDFINDLIRELSLQAQSNDNSDVVEKKINLAMKTFKRFCYDYPIIQINKINSEISKSDNIIEVKGSNDELNVLSEYIENLITGRSVDNKNKEFRSIFCLNNTFTENLISYIPSIISAKVSLELSSPGAMDTVDENLVFYSKSLNNLSGIIFYKFPEFLLTKCDRFKLSQVFNTNLNTIYSHLNENSSDGVISLEWAEIALKYKSFIMQISANIIPPINNNYSNINSDNERIFLQSLATAISVLNSIYINSNNSLKETTISSDNKNYKSLECYLNDNHSELLFNCTKDCWHHLIFTYRDILIRRPEFISTSNSIYLSLVCDNLMINNNNNNSYPNNSECLFVIVISNISNFVTNTINNNKVAKQSIKKYLCQNKNKHLISFVNICERMTINNNNKPFDCESINFLLDVGYLFIETNNNSIPHNINHNNNNNDDTLLTSRLLSILVNTAKIIMNNKSNNDHKIIDINISTTSHRLINFLSLLMMFNPFVGHYMIRIKELFNNIISLSTSVNNSNETIVTSVVLSELIMSLCLSCFVYISYNAGTVDHVIINSVEMLLLALENNNNNLLAVFNSLKDSIAGGDLEIAKVTDTKVDIVNEDDDMDNDNNNVEEKAHSKVQSSVVLFLQKLSRSLETITIGNPLENPIRVLLALNAHSNNNIDRLHVMRTKLLETLKTFFDKLSLLIVEINKSNPLINNIIATLKKNIKTFHSLNSKDITSNKID